MALGCNMVSWAVQKVQVVQSFGQPRRNPILGVPSMSPLKKKLFV